MGYRRITVQEISCDHPGCKKRFFIKEDARMVDHLEKEGFRLTGMGAEILCCNHKPTGVFPAPKLSS